VDADTNFVFLSTYRSWVSNITGSNNFDGEWTSSKQLCLEEFSILIDQEE